MKGIFTALLTPFKDDYSINEASLKKLVEFNLEKGINGFYVGGSTGEGLIMTTEERKEVFRIVKEAAGDKVPLIAHCGSISTDEAISMAKPAEDLGYDAVSAVAPLYYGFSFPAIRKYYDDIVSSVNIPMVVYNFPGGSGVTFTADYAAEMFEDERYMGIKHTSADLFTLHQFKQKIKRPVTIFNGFDEMCIGGLAMGADGEPKPKTSHSLNPVPGIIYDPEYKGEYDNTKLNSGLGISSWPSTLIELMGYMPPKDYDPSMINLK